MRLGVIVGDGESWRFFEEIYADWVSHYDVDSFRVRRPPFPIFYERVNRRLLQYDLDAFMKKQDVVFFEWASGLLAFASHLPKRCKVVVRLHRYEMFQWATKINWSFVDKVIFVSQAMRAKFASQFPNHQHKTVVIPVGITIEKFQMDRSGQSVGNIGTLCQISPRKRVYELILAFYDLSRNRNGLHLHIGGNTDPLYGDYNDALQQVVQKLNLRDKVTFYGDISKPWKWYRNIDVFVSNSYSEGLQVALMEAMASGCYCLAHHWDGAEELLPNEYLFFTDSEFQEKISRYLQASSAMQNQDRETMRRIACDKLDKRFIQKQIRIVIEGVNGDQVNRKISTQEN